MSKFLYVIGKVLVGELSCTLTGVIKLAATILLISAHIKSLLCTERCEIHWLQYQIKVLVVLEG